MEGIIPGTDDEATEAAFNQSVRHLDMHMIKRIKDGTLRRKDLKIHAVRNARDRWNDHLCATGGVLKSASSLHIPA